MGRRIRAEFQRRTVELVPKMGVSTLMSAENDSYAYFTIVSSQPLSFIESHLGFSGDGKCWSIGDTRPSGNGVYDFSRFSLLSGVDRGRPIEEHLQSLWRRMSKYRAQIISLPREMTRTVPCVASFASHRDVVQLSAGHFSTAAYFGAQLDCDFYFDDTFGDETKGVPYWEW